MSDLRPDSVQPPRPSSVPVPDFTPIDTARRSPVELLLIVLSALVAAAHYFLASPGS
jgi:hypothetical protein